MIVWTVVSHNSIQYIEKHLIIALKVAIVITKHVCLACNCKVDMHGCPITNHHPTLAKLQPEAI